MKNSFKQMSNETNIHLNKKKDIDIDLYELYKKNNDLIGWIRINGTNINYPVMQNGEDYYLRKNFEKEYSKYGLPFVPDYCNIINSNNTIIYGHHMKNDTMFAELEKYKKQSFYEKYKNIDIYYLNGEKTEKRTYEIISIFKILATDEDFKYYEFHDTESGDEFNNFIKEVKERSLYNINNTAKYGEKLLTLSTCEYSQADGRLVIVAKEK